MSKEKLICWRGTDGDLEPVECICQNKFGYPNYCNPKNEGEEMMYQNTHFLEKKDAWCISPIINQTKLVL